MAIILYGIDGDVNLPVKLDVCPNCQGKGSHVNRNIDSHGITAEEFAEDPDFEEAYFSGVYDVPCDECKGLRVVEVVNRDACTPEILKEYDEQLQEDCDYQTQCAAELRMGA